jgi:hypothetical protein
MNHRNALGKGVVGHHHHNQPLHKKEAPTISVEKLKHFFMKRRRTSNPNQDND